MATQILYKIVFEHIYYNSEKLTKIDITTLAKKCKNEESFTETIKGCSKLKYQYISTIHRHIDKLFTL